MNIRKLGLCMLNLVLNILLLLKELKKRGEKGVVKKKIWKFNWEA